MDELSPPDRAEVQAHLDACRRCREARLSLNEAAAALRGVPEIPPSAERRERAVEGMRRGAAERMARPRWERTLRALLGHRSRWGVAALFAASVAGVFFAGALPFSSRPAVSLVAESVQGNVTMERAPSVAAEPVTSGTRVREGCRVKIPPGAYAAFRVSSGGVIECREDTAFRLEPPVPGVDNVCFTFRGGLYGDLAPLPRGRFIFRDMAGDHWAEVVGTRFEVTAQ